MMRDDDYPPDTDIPGAPRSPSLPIRITREVAVPLVAIVYLMVFAGLRYVDRITEAAFLAAVLTPVGGYLGSLIPKVQDKNR